MMKLAFCLFNYFPYGGLQRDFLRIARVCKERGHDIHVYTMRWEGEQEADFHLHLIEVKAWQNHVRCHVFAKKLKKQLDQEQYDCVIGFNKMPYLDLYYAADVCYAARVAKQKGFLYRLLPRYRRWVEMEKAVFARGLHTTIMLLSAAQEAEYTRCYQTETERFHLLPPGIAKDRVAPIHAVAIRRRVRECYHFAEKDLFLLMVGSGFKTKGVDRTLRGIASLPAALQARCRLIVIGQDDPRVYVKMARHMQIDQRVHFLGGRSDVPDFLLAADFLLHPSYHENTGTVLLEALVAGLPVLTVAACGYARYVQEAEAGMVLAAPFRQAQWNALLQEVLLSPKRELWRKNGLVFAQQADIYRLPEQAADLIEKVGC